MRVTESQLQSLALRSLSDGRVRLLDAQEAAMTGRRVDTPSDDPTASARARLLGALQTESEGYLSIVEYGALRLQQAEIALSEGSSILVRVKELAMAMANETMNAEQRAGTATEIDELRRENSISQQEYEAKLEELTATLRTAVAEAMQRKSD